MQSGFKKHIYRRKKEMKKELRLRLNFAFALLFIAIMVIVVGCGTTAPAPATPAPQTAETPKPANPNIILATTTSTQDSGLLAALIPVFEQKTGYKVKTIAVGTGAALAMGDKGNADVLLVHAPSSEQKLVDNLSLIHISEPT